MKGWYYKTHSLARAMGALFFKCFVKFCCCYIGSLEGYTCITSMYTMDGYVLMNCKTHTATMCTSSNTNQKGELSTKCLSSALKKTHLILAYWYIYIFFDQLSAFDYSLRSSSLAFQPIYLRFSLKPCTLRKKYFSLKNSWGFGLTHNSMRYTFK